MGSGAGSHQGGGGVSRRRRAVGRSGAAARVAIGVGVGAEQGLYGAWWSFEPATIRLLQGCCISCQLVMAIIMFIACGNLRRPGKNQAFDLLEHLRDTGLNQDFSVVRSPAELIALGPTPEVERESNPCARYFCKPFTTLGHPPLDLMPLAPSSG